MDISTANNELQIICNKFIEESIGNKKIKVMLPVDKIPIIKAFNYDKGRDLFEIVFKYESNKKTTEKKQDNISFLEIDNQLVAIHIHNYSKMNVKQIRLDVFSTIDNRIKQVNMALHKNERIQNNIIEKRKLQFTKNLIKEQAEEISF